MANRVRQFAQDVYTLTRPYFLSSHRGRAWGMLLLLLSLALVVAGTNWLINRVGGRFTNVYVNKQIDQVPLATAWLLGAFVMGTTVAVLYRYTEERLGLMWRRWFTHHLIHRYLRDDNYHRLLARTDIDNPDQRIAEDVKTFTQTTLSILLILLNSSMALIVFSGVLWTISPWLFFGAVIYSALGTGTTLLLGSKLVGLNINQFRREADLRYHLIHIRDQAEAVGALRDKPREGLRLEVVADAAMANYRLIIGVNRNLGFFTNIFNYLPQILPFLIVSPLYFRNQIEYGQVYQAQTAFMFVLNAFSLIVSEFQRFSSFTAVVVRLKALYKATAAERDEPPPPILIEEDERRFVFDHLTLRSPDDRVLLADLHCEFPSSSRVLVTGSNIAARSALHDATIGLWKSGSGRIVRPPLAEIMSIPTTPKAVHGTLRDQILFGSLEGDPSQSQLEAALRAVKLDYWIRPGIWEEQRDWANVLSLDELQRLAIARLFVTRPRVAFLDAAIDALAPAMRQTIYERLSQSGIAYVSLISAEGLRPYHDLVLELLPDGSWKLEPVNNSGK